MLVQLILNAIVSGLTFAAVGLSFSLIYTPAKFLHFAHGAVCTAAAYATFTALVSVRAPVPLAITTGVVVAALLGCGCEICLYRPLRRRKASNLAALLASLGLYIVMQNVISTLYGDDAKALRVGQATAGIPVFGARLAQTQILLASGCISAMLVVWLILRYTRFGKALRAVASDSELAVIRGIDASRTILWAFALGSGVVGLIGALIGFDVDIVPTMGLSVMMMGLVAMILGGTRSLPGILLAGIVLGLVQNLAVWKIGSQWQDAVAFAMLIAFIVLRPQGVLGVLSQKSQI